MMTAKEIRDALESRYPDVTDSEFNIAQSGFTHEHPLIAIGSGFDLLDSSGHH